MELKNFSQEVNEQLFGKGSRQVSMGEFIDMSVSAHKSRSDEQNVIRETAAGNKIVIKPRRVRFNGIELSQEQFRALVDIPLRQADKKRSLALARPARRGAIFLRQRGA